MRLVHVDKYRRLSIQKNHKIHKLDQALGILTLFDCELKLLNTSLKDVAKSN